MYKITVLINTYQQGRIFGPEDYVKLGQLGYLHVYDRANFTDREYVLDFVKNTNLLILSWESPRIEQDILDACPDLKGVIYGAGSLRPIMTKAFLESGIPISDSKIVDSRSVAVTVLGVAISACKGLFTVANDVRKGLWRDNMHTIKDFYHITIGVVGASCAGSYFVELLQNFDVKVLVYDPIKSAEEIEKMGAEKTDLETLLRESDVISIHAPALPETDNMINKDNLPLIKDGAVFMNTSRGSLINEADLIEECKKNRFLVFLDVFTREPTPLDNPLRTLSNVICLPHVAGTITNGVRQIGDHVCQEAERFMKGEKMQCQVDLTKLNILA